MLTSSTEKKQRLFEAQHKRITQVRKETLIRNTRCTGSFSQTNKIKPQTRRITVLGRATVEMAVGVRMASSLSTKCITTSLLAARNILWEWKFHRTYSVRSAFSGSLKTLPFCDEQRRSLDRLIQSSVEAEVWRNKLLPIMPQRLP